MRNDRLILIVALLVLFIILLVASAYYAFFAGKDEDNGEVPREETQEFIDSNSVTLESLATHNKVEDCWIGYDGHIFDLSDLIATGRDLEVKDCGTKVSRELDEDLYNLMKVYQIADLKE